MSSVALTPPDVTTVAQHVIAQAAEAAHHDHTYGVGGALVGPDGTIYKEMHNRVVQDGQVSDPTAHGERQLVSWYEENHDRLHLPEARDMTIVTTLDPCMMCTGALETWGGHVAVIAADPHAGVDYDATHDMKALPPTLRDLAQHNFSYLGIEGDRPFGGSHESIYNNQSISHDLGAAAASIFMEGAQNARAMLKAEEPQAYDIRTLPASSVQRTLLQKVDPDAVTVNVKDAGAHGADVLRQTLMAKAAQAHAAGNAYDAGALIDPHGNILMTVGNNEGTHAIDTPFMLLMQKYAAVRRDAGDAKDGSLPPVRDCTVALLNAPGPTSTGVMDVGAYGSSMGTKHKPDNLLYVQGPPKAEIDAMIAAMPPLYSKLANIGVQPLTQASLTKALG